MAFAALTIDLNARLAKFEQDMQRTTKSLDGLNSRANALASGFRTAFGAAGLALGVGGMIALSKSTIDSADSLKDMSDRLRVSVKTLAGFKLAAEQSGTSLENVGTGISKLTKNIGLAEAGNREMASALKQLGVTARDPQEAFFQLADAVNRIEDPTKRAALLSQVLGKSYTELIPLLAEGSEGLRKSAQESESFADAMARLAPNADKFNDQLALLKTNAAGIFANVAADFIGPLLDITAAMREAAREGGLLTAVWVGLGGLGNLVFNGTELKQASAEMERLQTLVDGTLEKLNTGKARVPFTPFDVKFNDQAISTLKKNLSEYEKQLGSATAAFNNLTNPPSVKKQKPREDNSDQLACVASGGTWDGKKCNPKKSGSSAKASDPLASIIASTDIAKTQEYNKLLALLSVRFQDGSKDAELYAQAVASLNDKFGKTQIDVFDSGAFKTANKDVADFIRTQQEAINDLNKGIAEDSANAFKSANDALDSLLAGADFTKLKKDQEDAVLLTLAFTDGIQQADGSLRKLSESEYLDAITNRLGLAGEKINEMDNFAKTAADSIQKSFADFLFDPFANGVDGMLKGFANTVKRMIADAIAADLAKKLFGDVGKGGGGNSGSGDWTKAVASIFGFADGGVMTSKGPLPLRSYAGGGIASSPQLSLIGDGATNEAYVPLPDGRSIPVKMQGGGSNINITNNIDARGADAGMLPRLQAMMESNNQRLKSEILDSRRRNGAFA